MKNKICLVLAIFMILAIFSSCGGAGITGVYACEGNTIELKEDGTAVLFLYGISFNGTYVLDGQNLTIKASILGETDEMQATIEENKITIEQDGKQLFYEKK